MVLSEKLLPQYTSRSSRLGPRRSRIRTLSSASTPDHLMFEIPAEMFKKKKKIEESDVTSIQFKGNVCLIT